MPPKEKNLVEQLRSLQTKKGRPKSPLSDVKNAHRKLAEPAVKIPTTLAGSQGSPLTSSMAKPVVATPPQVATGQMPPPDIAALRAGFQKARASKRKLGGMN